MGEISEALRRAGRSSSREERNRSLSSASSVGTFADVTVGDIDVPEEPDSEMRMALLRSRELSQNRELRDLPVPSASASAATSTSTQPDPRYEQSLQCITREPGPERVAALDPMSPAAVSARHLAQNIKRRADRAGIRSIVLTSPLSGEGKTTTACNLAVALSQLDQSRAVVLLDLDVRRPRVAKSLGLRVRRGIEDVLGGRASLDEALIQTDVPGLWVVGVRRSVEKPEQILSSSLLSDLIRSLHSRFASIIIDTPPILAVSDASSVIDAADACVLVVRAGRSPTASVRHAAGQLPPEKALGCCLNFARGSARSSGYEYYAPRAQEPDESEIAAPTSDGTTGVGE